MKKPLKRKSIADSRNEDVKSLEHLTLTRNLNSENGLPHDVWDWLTTQYQAINESDSVSRAMCSVINSILNQERIYFAISRRGMQELVRFDKNFKQKSGEAFRDSLYSKILSKLMEDGYISQFIDSKGSFAAAGYEVVDEVLLAFLERKIDRNVQMKQVSDFISKKTTGTRVGTKDDKMVRSKEAKEQRSEAVKTASNVDTHKVVTINPEHKSLLEQATAVNPSHWFLPGKVEALNKYGSFTEKQLGVLRDIAVPKAPKQEESKVLQDVVTTVKTKGTKDIAIEILKLNSDPLVALKLLSAYTFNTANPDNRILWFGLLESKSYEYSLIIMKGLNPAWATYCLLNDKRKQELQKTQHAQVEQIMKTACLNYNLAAKLFLEAGIDPNDHYNQCNVGHDVTEAYRNLKKATA